MKFLLSICLYLVLFYSIFTIYYTSPLIRNTEPIPLNITPLVTHLVFMVTDGMRVDKLFGGSMDNSPFIRTLLLNKAVWGLSHTRVPTESRPGHIAMLGGFYEDVSAVTKGWQANPVEFDSILNRSLRAWAWGTHEVVRPFESVDSDHIAVRTTPKELADMSRPTLNDADRWVVDQFLRLVKDTKNGFFALHSASESDIRTFRRGQFAFLHLDAADLTGHAFKPKSPTYSEMIRHLDAVVAEVVHSVSQASAESGAKVAFILTSDHGMTDWGSHGAGSLHETATPLLAWGAGFVGPEIFATPPNSTTDFDQPDQYGLPKHNHGRVRREIKQADLCPLMASLLGIPIPVNSVGRIPLGMLDTDAATKVKLIRANCLQLLVQVEAKLNEQRRSHLSMLFKEYPHLTSSHISEMLSRAEALAKQSRFDEAISEYTSLADLAVESLNYYHKYDRGFLGFCIGATFFLWSLIIIATLVTPRQAQYAYQENHGSVFLLLRAVLLVSICLTLWLARFWPISHTIYQLTPLFLALYLLHSSSGAQLLHQFLILLSSISGHWAAQKNTSGSILSRQMTYMFLLSVLLLELVIWGFHYRPLLAFACVLLALWPFVDSSFGQAHAKLRTYWSLCSLLLGIFPLLPVIGSTFYPLLGCASGIFAAPLSIHCLRRVSRLVRSRTPLPSNVRRYNFTQLLPYILVLASCCVGVIHSTLGSSMLVKLVIHAFGWISLVCLPIGVIFGTPPLLGFRLYGWINVFHIMFVLLSTGYEVIFLLVFVSLGFLWIQLEAPANSTDNLWSLRTNIKGSQEDHGSASITLQDFRQSLFFIVLLTLSFFGTGNIASVNSFDPRSTYCFITSLNPMVMGFFLLVKVLIPMLCLGVIYAVVQATSHNHDHPQFSNDTRPITVQTGLVTVISNFIAVHFFAWLRDEGSWLDIGNSISHYIIAMGIGLAAFLFARLGRSMLIGFRTIFPLTGPRIFTEHS